MKTIEIFDPALCCSSGACGPAPDQALAAFAGAVEKLKAQGIAVKRYNLAQEPLAFAQKTEVKSVLEKQGENGLPLLFVDGELFFRGVYPTEEQLATALGTEEAENCCGDSPTESPVTFVKVAAPKPAGSGCCDPSSGCC